MPQNLIGKIFGRLKVAELTEKREDRYRVWRCKCLCGGEILVNTKRLLRGTVTDCGCIPKSTARRGAIAEDLTGKHFGKWEVLYRAENHNKRVMWVCRCSCGTLRTISARDLKEGRACSCKNPIHSNSRKYQELTKAERRHYYEGTTLESIGLNRKARSDNRLGVPGVNKVKSGAYRTTIGFQGKKYYLGTFPSIEEAGNVYRNAKRALHGEFIKAYTAWTEDGRRRNLIFDVSYIDGAFVVESNY